MKSFPKRRATQHASGNTHGQAALPDPTPILLAQDLAPADIARLLQSYHLQDWKHADQNLQAMAGEPASRKAFAKILAILLTTISRTADPDQALNEWERYVNSGIHRLQLFHYLAAAPHLVEVLGLVFGNSPAMAQTLIRDPMLVYWIEDDRVLFRRQARKTLIETLQGMLAGVKRFDVKCEALRRFKRREMLRIGIRDLLGLASPRETYTALSDLAAIVIQFAHDLVDQHLQQQHGTWTLRSSVSKPGPAGFSVLAMGKLGGWELNYSSDVDLIFVFQAFSETTPARKGHQALSGVEYFQSLARELTTVLSTSTAEGALFRVDLRLRPEGEVGPLACSLEDAHHYYLTRGRTWERLAFLKAKPIAGNLQIGRSLIRKLGGFVYGTRETAQQVVPAIRELRSQMISKLTRRGELDRNVKLGIGGIREIEFIVQSLQLRWAYRYPSIKDRQTLKSLSKLFKVGKLTLSMMEELRESYLFLRNVENKVQMVEELQTHVLPAKTDEIAKCAIRMGYPKTSSIEQTAQNFVQDYSRHTARVHRYYRVLLEYQSVG